MKIGKYEVEIWDGANDKIRFKIEIPVKNKQYHGSITGISMDEEAMGTKGET